MKKYLFISFLLITELAFGQKIFLSNGKNKVRIKNKSTVGITFKGDQFHFENWHFYGDACLDSAGYKNIWFIDSISNGGIYASRYPLNDSEYGVDTIGKITKELNKKYESWWEIDVIYEDTNSYRISKYIIEYPLFMEKKLIQLDSVQSLSFAKKKGVNKTLTSSAIGASFMVINGTSTAIKNGLLNDDNWTFILAGLIWSTKISISIQRSKIKTYSLTEWRPKFK